MRILVDMDGVLCDTLTPWLAGIAARTGVRAAVDDITQWGLEACPPLDRVDKAIIFGVLDEPGLMRNVRPIPGAVAAVKRLSAAHEVYITTARHGAHAMPETMEWVKEHLPFLNPRRQVIFIHEKTLIPADAIVDDKAETLEAYHAAYPKAICTGLLYPYNARLLSETWCHLEKRWQGMLRRLTGASR